METIFIEQFVKECNLLCINGVKSTKLKPILPVYQLDFGYVVYGLISSRTVSLSNPGPFPVTITPSHSTLKDTGFSVDLAKKIKGLPVDTTMEFIVMFDPAAANSPLGLTEATLSLQVCTYY